MNGGVGGAILATIRIFVEKTSRKDVPVILNILRSERINALAGAIMSQSEAIVLVDHQQVNQAIQIIERLGFNTRVA